MPATLSAATSTPRGKIEFFPSNICSIFNFSDIRFRLKAALDEANEQLDIVRRENKNLADEVKDLLDQLGDGGRSIHELDKQRRRLEVRQ